MTPKIRSVGRGPGGRRYLSSDRELRLGVCFWFRLFNVVPETTARFSYLDDRSRNQSPPSLGLPRPLLSGHHCTGSIARGLLAEVVGPTRRSSGSSPWRP